MSLTINVSGQFGTLALGSGGQCHYGRVDVELKMRSRSWQDTKEQPRPGPKGVATLLFQAAASVDH